MSAVTYSGNMSLRRLKSLLPHSAHFEWYFWKRMFGQWHTNYMHKAKLIILQICSIIIWVYAIHLWTLASPGASTAYNKKDSIALRKMYYAYICTRVKSSLFDGIHGVLRVGEYLDEPNSLFSGIQEESLLKKFGKMMLRNCHSHLKKYFII